MIEEQNIIKDVYAFEEKIKECINKKENIPSNLIAVLDEAKALQESTNEKYRIEDINKKAGEVIEAKYPITKQLNYPRGSDGSLFVTGNVTVNQMYSWIDNVREKSNLAIANGLTLQEFIDSITE